MSLKYIICKNCDSKIREGDPYCPHCGQETKLKLSIRVLFSNLISNYFSVDARFFKTVWPLFLKPGFIAQQFVNGKRKTYLHPVKIYLFTVFVFFFGFSFYIKSHVETLNTVSEKETTAQIIDSIKIQQNNVVPVLFRKSKTIDSLLIVKAPKHMIYKQMGLDTTQTAYNLHINEQILKLYKKKNFGTLYGTFFNYLPFSFFLLLPVFALLLKLVYFKNRPYVNHLVFTLYYFSFVFLGLSTMLLLSFFTEIPALIEAIVLMGLMPLNLIIALKVFYKSRWMGAIFKSLFLGFLYLILALPLSFVLTIFISFLFF